MISPPHGDPIAGEQILQGGQLAGAGARLNLGGDHPRLLKRLGGIVSLSMGAFNVPVEQEGATQTNGGADHHRRQQPQPQRRHPREHQGSKR